MTPAFWKRWLQRREAEADEEESELEHMSPDERRVSGEAVEEYQADEFVQEHLGGFASGRPPGDDLPRDRY
jgi:hypothetical protein